MIITKYFASRFAPRWLILQIDIVLSLVALLTAYILRHNFEIESIPLNYLKLILPLHILNRVIFFRIFRVYRGITRYTGVQDAKRLFYAITLGSFVLLAGSLALEFATGERQHLPFSVVFIDYMGTLVLLTSFRISVKILYSEYNQKNQSNRKTIAIFGAGRSGIITKRTLDQDGHSNTRVITFFDDNEDLYNKMIDGVKVLPMNKRQLHKLIVNHQLTEIIISVQKLTAQRKQDIIDLCLDEGLKVKIVPPANKWVNGELSLQQIKKVNIEDLLERDPIRIDTDHIKSDVGGKVVLVTGAAGSIGSEMVRQLVKFYPALIVLLDNSETPLAELKLEFEERYRYQKFKFVLTDVRNKDAIRKVFSIYQPELVYHVAAYKHVPMMEENVNQAIRTNVLGTKNVADLSNEYGAKKFIMVSTDKAVNPTNVMGASKRIAEIYVQSLNYHLQSVTEKSTKYITTRFGNVLGSNGSVIPRFKRQIEAGGPVTVTHPEITRYFMTIPEACQLIMEAGNMGQGGEIYIFDMGKDVKIVDLAKKMIKLSGFEPDRDIKVVFTGLRPGEKIKEELLNIEENTLPTHHNKIMIAQVRRYSFEKVLSEIEILIGLSCGDDDFEMVGKMKSIVPEFISNNSQFAALDKNNKMSITG